MNMEQRATSNMQKIAREIEGAPVAAHGYRLRPVAKVQGWWRGMPTGEAQATPSGVNVTGGGAFVQVTPLALYVEHGEDTPQRIALDTANQIPLRKMVVVGIAIAVVSMLINLLIMKWS